MSLLLAPQVFRVSMKDKEAELKSVGSSTVLNFTVVPYLQKDGEETLWVQAGIWGVRAEKLLGLIRHNDVLLLSGDLTAKKGTSGDKVFYSLNVADIKRIEYKRLIPAQGDQEPSENVKSAKIAASSFSEPDMPF